MIRTDGRPTIANAPRLTKEERLESAPAIAPGALQTLRIFELEREVARLKRELERAR